MGPVAASLKLKTLNDNPYPIPFAIAQKLNPDGSLTIKRNMTD